MTLEVRVAKLESDVEHIKNDVSEIKADLKDMRKEQTDFRVKTAENFTGIQKEIANQTKWLFALNITLVGIVIAVIRFFP